MSTQTLDPVAERLQKAAATDATRADAWDAYQSSSNADELATKLKGLSLPNDVKADLWDLKQRSTAAPDFKTESLPYRDPRAALGEQVIEAGKGALKGAASTAVSLGRYVHKIPGVDTAFGEIPDTAEATLGLESSNTAQKVGRYVEQAAEYLLPGAAAEHVAAATTAKLLPYFRNAPRLVQAAVRMVPRAAANAGASAGVATVQHENPTTAALTGAAGPLVGAATREVGAWVGTKAEPLVRAAIKPTVAAMRRVAGASATGVDAQASKLVNFIIENGTTTAEKARLIITNADKELQTVLSLKNAPTDAPQRAVRYLAALERSAAKQGLPAQDVAIIRNAAAEVLESGLGEDVITMVPTPHPTLVDPAGKPITVLMPKTTRALRTDVSPTEAMERARANSQWDTRKGWGEQKGAQMEASKAVERAERDAVKDAVPEARPILARQGMAIKAAEVLDRMEFRQANRDAVSLPAHVMAAGELAAGKVPLLAFAANWLRNNQMKAGIWAYRLSNALAKQDVQETAAILNRFGVGATVQAESR